MNWMTQGTMVDPEKKDGQASFGQELTVDITLLSIDQP
jgi:hypothetical protein